MSESAQGTEKAANICSSLSMNLSRELATLLSKTWTPNSGEVKLVCTCKRGQFQFTKEATGSVSFKIAGNFFREPVLGDFVCDLECMDDFEFELVSDVDNADKPKGIECEENVKQTPENVQSEEQGDTVQSVENGESRNVQGEFEEKPKRGPGRPAKKPRGFAARKVACQAVSDQTALIQPNSTITAINDSEKERHLPQKQEENPSDNILKGRGNTNLKRNRRVIKMPRRYRIEEGKDIKTSAHLSHENQPESEVNLGSKGDADKHVDMPTNTVTNNAENDKTGDPKSETNSTTDAKETSHTTDNSSQREKRIMKTRKNATKRNGDPVLCPICQFPCKNGSAVYVHLKVKHRGHPEKRNYIQMFRGAMRRLCSLCGRMYHSSHGLKHHLQRVHHLGEVTGEFPCEDCGQVFKRRDLVKAHKQREHSGRPLTCHLCGKTYKTYLNLQEHIKYFHELDSKLECPHCHKYLSNRQTLRRHVLKFHDEKQTVFCCSICGKQFRDKTSVQVHMLHKHEDAAQPEFPCTECGKKFTWRTALRNHMEGVHKIVKQKEFACTVCGKTFVAKVRLHNHMRQKHSNSTVLMEVDGEGNQNRTVYIVTTAGPETSEVVQEGTVTMEIGGSTEDQHIVEETVYYEMGQDKQLQVQYAQPDAQMNQFASTAPQAHGATYTSVPSGQTMTSEVQSATEAILLLESMTGESYGGYQHQQQTQYLQQQQQQQQQQQEQLLNQQHFEHQYHEHDYGDSMTLQHQQQ